MIPEKDLRALVDRFLDGETTLAEERALYDAFAASDLPADLAALRPMFRDLGQALRPIDDAQACPSGPGETVGKALARRPLMRRLRWMGAAAVACACVFVLWLAVPRQGAEPPARHEARVSRPQLLAPAAEPVAPSVKAAAETVAGEPQRVDGRAGRSGRRGAAKRKAGAAPKARLMAQAGVVVTPEDSARWRALDEIERCLAQYEAYDVEVERVLRQTEEEQRALSAVQITIY